jgi:hypothetical protein
VADEPDLDDTDDPELTAEERDELALVARRWIQGEVYVQFIDPDNVHDFAMQWPVITLAVSSDDPEIPDDLVGAWEELGKASPRSVNGRPMFFSAHVLRRHQARFVLEKAKKMQEALNAAQATE